MKLRPLSVCHRTDGPRSALDRAGISPDYVHKESRNCSGRFARFGAGLTLVLKCPMVHLVFSRRRVNYDNLPSSRELSR